MPYCYGCNTDVPYEPCLSEKEVHEDAPETTASQNLQADTLAQLLLGITKVQAETDTTYEPDNFIETEYIEEPIYDAYFDDEF